MPPHRAVEAVPTTAGVRTLGQRALLILWPAFLMAGVLETLVFAVVDPESLQGFGGEPLYWAREAVYSLAFFVFWGVIAAATATTQWLARSPPPGVID